MVFEIWQNPFLFDSSQNVLQTFQVLDIRTCDFCRTNILLMAQKLTQCSFGLVTLFEYLSWENFSHWLSWPWFWLFFCWWWWWVFCLVLLWFFFPLQFWKVILLMIEIFLHQEWLLWLGKAIKTALPKCWFATAIILIQAGRLLCFYII